LIIISALPPFYLYSADMISASDIMDEIKKAQEREEAKRLEALAAERSRSAESESPGQFHVKSLKTIANRIRASVKDRRHRTKSESR
jgi:DNA topoisomerase VI subunit B